ncbi:MAG: AMP-binding protein [Ndongobacter sp.]|nr:AMP-binding protein [Ndongobacter sp.]
MELFSQRGADLKKNVALLDDGTAIAYEEIVRIAQRLRPYLERKLVFLLCQNTPGTLLGYLSCLQVGAVPLLLDAHIAPELLAHLASIYHPAYYYVPDDLAEATRAQLPKNAPCEKVWDSELLSSGEEGPQLHHDLALLLTTSGSTGSPKLVRLTRRNLEENTRSIVSYLGITEADRPITMLPMSYSYGMSIINTHVWCNATILLTRYDLMTLEFWRRVKEEGATSLAGIPYTYRMLSRLGLTEMELPALNTLTQAGGKLPLELHQKFGAWSLQTGRRFFVMYGQTEAAPRMGYLPPDKTLEKCGSLGIAVPGGILRLMDDAGREITQPDVVGELVYFGANVSFGYAQEAGDLAKGDEFHGVLHTGDMARRDREGYFYIVGRKKRFIKVFGNRVNLDDAERMLSAAFPGANFACVGRDDELIAYTDARTEAEWDEMRDYLQRVTNLPGKALALRPIARIPVNEAGKTLYSQLPVE